MKSTARHGLALLPALGLFLLGACASDRTTTRTESGEPMPSAPTIASQRRSTEAEQVQAREAAARTGARRASGALATASMAYPTGDPGTSSILIERFMPAEAVVGMPVEYETVITNLTALQFDNVVITETADSNFTILRSEPGVTKVGASANEWHLGALRPHETMSIQVVGSPKAAQPVQNCTSVSYTAAVCASFSVVQPALQLVASGTPEALVCDELLYTYKVTNSGTGAAKNVTIDVQLPQGIADAKGQRTFKKTIESLASGRSEEFSIKAKGSRTGTFTSTAVATAEGNLRAAAGDVRTVLSQPKLTIVGEGTTRAFEGRDLEASFIVTNEGDAIAREVTVEQTVPSSVRFKSATAGGRHTSGMVRWTLTDLKPRESRKIAASFESLSIGTVRSTATAKTYCADPASAVLETRVEGIPAVLLEVVDLKDPIVVGTELTYLITVTNQGSAPATGVTIAVRIPEQATFIGATGQTTTMAQPGTNEFSFAPVASIEPKKAVSWRVTVRGVKPGDARFRVRMTSNELQSPVEESEATFFYD